MMTRGEWVPEMRAMVRWLGDEDLRTSEALCVRAVGDFMAGMVLHRILLLEPKGIREDGAIWKSDHDWRAELGLSYHHMKKVRARLEPLVQIWIEQAQGAPTYHYLVKPEPFFTAVSRAIMRSMAFVRAWFKRCVEKRFSNLIADGRKIRKSITTDSTTDKSTDSVLDFLISFGVNQSEAGKLAWLPRDLVESYAKIAVKKARAGKQAGYLLAMLRRYVEKHPQTSPPAPLPDGEGSRSRLNDTLKTDLSEDVPDFVKAHQAELGLRRWEHEPPQEAPKTGSPAWAWEATKDQLEIQLDRANFETWLRDATFAHFEAPATFVISVRNQFARDNLQYRLDRTICRVLRDVFGSAVEVQFVIREAVKHG